MHYSFKSTPTWTMKSRPHTSCSNYPGPSDYIVKKPLPNSGNVSAVTQQRNLYKKFEPVPGPGSYKQKSYITAGQKRSMSARYFQPVKPSPGPHQYDNDTIKVKNTQPHFSMSTKSMSYHQLTIEKNQFSPSPTKYQHAGSFKNKTGVVIGTSNRKDLTQTQKTPAPNHYISQKAKDYTSETNPKCNIGTEFRKTTGFMHVQNTPGPAQYDKKTIFEENKQKIVGFSCRKKTADLIALQISKFPGPGNYQSHLKNKSSAPRFANPGEARKTFIDDMQDFQKPFPAPVQYNPQMKGTKYRSVSVYDFGKSTRKPLDQNEKTPGPVQYRNQKIDVLNTAPKFSVTKTIAKNQFLAVNPENPGPGSYDPQLKLVKQASQQYEVGKEKRPDFEKHRYTPGPGFYNLRGKQSGPGWGFSKQLRIAFTDKKSEAKDGTHYNIPQKVVDPPKYMNVSSKVRFESPNKTGFSTMNSNNKGTVQQNQ